MIKSNRGQLSIFMGITLIIVMGMLAFIINVGLFVKAKINLQNAVDAAAFSGAATQARQLTNIAYVNWEIRNTFKEWMFKYYILGELGLVKGNNNLSNSGLSANGPNTNFLLKTPPVSGNTSTDGNLGFDKFNVPSICVHNNSSTDICPIYALPGIPRFPAIGVAGISEIHEAFVNKLVEEKGANCSARTQINFLAALSWAYSSGIKEIAGAPLIATNRAGAWPEALELALRMRNLEMITNRPPVENMDIATAQQLGGVGTAIGLNERPIKAFWSAFRNLGGGKYKDALLGSGNKDPRQVDELSATFKLTEIAPQPFVADPLTVSGFLIPSTFNYPGTGFRANQKHYLDLQIVPINYATMFSTFATTRNEFEPTVDSEASCFVSKSAMPVPGYVLGFVKNPSVITYYAVKGEAEFTGLFFPSLTSSGSFKLTAYAAAKPFGGRIGPRLFSFLDGNSAIIPRDDANSKSSAYISGIDVGPNPSFKPGLPIPPSNTFWVNEFTSVVGGIPGSAGNTQIAYGIPNLIYDFENGSDLDDQNGGVGGNSKIQTIKAQPIAGSSTTEKRGLYRSRQLGFLKNSLENVDYTGKNMTSNDLLRALILSRRVTRYDAVNYLIPDMTRTSATVTNALPTVMKLPGAIPSGPSGMGNGSYYKIFAPLVGQDLLYTSDSVLTTTVGSYISSNEQAINIYLQALLDVANTIFNLPSGVGNATNVNALAAKSIHENAGNPTNPIPALLVGAEPTDATCKKDMASKFNHFFRGGETECGIVPLTELMVGYIDKKNQGDGKIYYKTTYYNDLPADTIMTAYYPGTRQGADQSGNSINPISSPLITNYSTRRNFYSTKFIAFHDLFPNGAFKEDAFLESETVAPIDLLNLTKQNPVINDSTTGFDKPYYNDF